MELPLYERHELMTLSEDQIAVFIASRELAPAIRQAMSELASLQAQLADRQAVQTTLVRQLNTVIEDQGRLRNNLEAVPRGSDLHQRYLEKMTEQEDRIDALRTQMATAREAVEQAQQDVVNFVRGLNV